MISIPKGVPFINEDEMTQDIDVSMHNGTPFTGIGLLYYDNQKIEYLTTYKNGFEHGAIINYSKNGNLASITEVKRGMKHGEKKEWHNNGTLSLYATYESGILTSEKQWNTNGTIIKNYEIDKHSTNYSLLERMRQEKPIPDNIEFIFTE